jgi:hypothetical protein
MTTGDRVELVRRGTVSFVRSGFARVRWADDSTSDEWVPDLRLVSAAGWSCEERGHRHVLPNGVPSSCCVECGVR